MVYAIILGIVFGLGTIGMIALAIWGAMDDGNVRKVVGGIGAFACFVLFLCIPFSFHQIDAGEVAVVKHMGSISGVRTEGTYFDFWMTEKYERYDAKVQTLDIVESAYSSDKQTMDITMTVQYQIMPNKAGEIAKTYGSLETLSNRIRSVSIERTKAELSKHSADEIIETRQSISPTVQATVKEAISDNYFVEINAVVLTNIDFSDAYEKIVEETMMAKQEETKAEFEKRVAIINAQKELETAKLQADAKLYAAEQDAEAKKAAALAEAVSTSSKIAKLAESLGYTVTPQYADKIVTETKTGEDSKEIEVIVYEADGITPKTIKNKDAIIGYVIDWTDKDGKVDEDGKMLLLEYLKYLEYLAAWDGELPDVVAGDNGFMITVPSTPQE